jgi:Tol biopolymer transport system component
MFEPSVAIDGNRVLYSAFYGGRPQVYLYDIPSGAVTQLTNDPADPQAAYGEQVQVQISGDWAAWQRGYNDQAIYLHSLATGETKQCHPQSNFTSWRLTGGRLAWTEGTPIHAGRLYLYDPATDSRRTIGSADGLLSFAMDDTRIAWVGGASWNEIYLYDLATGETKKIADTSQQG